MGYQGLQVTLCLYTNLTKETRLVWQWEYYPIPAHLIWSYCQSNADCTFYQGNFHWSLLQLRCADCHHHIDRVTRGINTLDLCYKAELLPEWWLSGWHCHLRAKMSLVRFPAVGWLLLWCTAWPTSTSKCAKHSDYQLGTGRVRATKLRLDHYWKPESQNKRVTFSWSLNKGRLTLAK